MPTVTDPRRVAAEEYAQMLRTVFPDRPDRPAEVQFWHARGDNYEPVPRTEHYGYMVRTDTARGDTPTIVLWGSDFGREVSGDLFLIDDGRTVTPHFVSGYSPNTDRDAVFLQPFPLDFNADGTPRMTGDGVRDAMGRPSRPVDMSGWSIGPRRAWHLKVRPLPE